MQYLFDVWKDMEELKKEVREARRIKMLHQPSKAMDLENEIRILRNTFAEKSKDCVSLLKEVLFIVSNTCFNLLVY
ncbi:Stomatal closure-related actin-binding protein 1 [Zea mays]|uniref:Stomatal closure-related actin-binding protein 1 n=1 Tax=Zea mays TaxID=4577 RepID=A0A1D6P9G5_MAIZE|nr:Stomatal closure-related actin-binding protein 1 [Zea mays]